MINIGVENLGQLREAVEKLRAFQDDTKVFPCEHGERVNSALKIEVKLCDPTYDDETNIIVGTY